MSASTPLLMLENVERTYDEGKVQALRSLSLVVSAGDYFSVTGPSGAGKSTLLNVLGLLDRPTGGSYRVRGVETVGAGEDVRTAMRGSLFGFVFQAYHLLAGRTAAENVELGLLYGRHAPRLRRALATEALDRVRMSHRCDADPRTLSGGERQRVAIARAIAGRPSVLLCDEPTGNLDTANTTNVLELLHELHDEGLTLVVVTHDEDVAGRAARRLVVVDGEGVLSASCAA